MPGTHLVESVVVVQFGDAMQGRVDAVEFILLVDELVLLHIPGDMAGIRHDLEILHRGDQALLIFVEIPGIGERQGCPCLLEYFDREC